MIDFNEMIGNHLYNELGQRQVGRYYPSEAGSCIRRIWYSYKIPKQVDRELIKIFEMGHMIHGFIADVIKSEKNPHVELVGEEVPFRFSAGDITISGRIDDIMGVKIDGKNYLVEVKSTSAIKYTLEPTESHVLQLQLYMHYNKIKNGIIVYVEKNNLQVKQFEVSYSKSLAEEAISRLNRVHEFLASNQLPEAEAGMDEKKKWQCKNCQYLQECEQNKESI